MSADHGEAVASLIVGAEGKADEGGLTSSYDVLSTWADAAFPAVALAKLLEACGLQHLLHLMDLGVDMPMSATTGTMKQSMRMAQGFNTDSMVRRRRCVWRKDTNSHKIRTQS